MQSNKITTNKILKFDDNTILKIGDYFRAYKSKYFTLIKDIANEQRNWEDGYGEYKITMYQIDIFDKEEKLIAENSIVPADKLISGALAKYIPDLKFDPTYLGNTDPYNHPAEYKIWCDMRNWCYDYNNKVFPYVGGVGTIICDRWRCFEYFVADFKHIEGYNRDVPISSYMHHAIDIYDIQKHIHPSKRVYAPGYVKLKEFKNSDICKYYNAPLHIELYPRDQIITSNYITGVVDIKETLFKKQTGMNVKLDIDTANYYYDSKIGYQPLSVAMINPYVSYAYNMYYNPYNTYIVPQQMKEMCAIVRKE